jgi:poly-gamma-glutamate synthesis protein (capsule biosynthesis protein)
LEHGITNLLDPINSVFPKAKIVPIIIRQDTPKDKVILLEQSLENACTDHCLLIASVDFSHYNPAALAEIHDNLSIAALNNLDEDLAWKTEVDSPQSLLLLVRWAKNHQTNKFNLFLNTNSGYLTHDLDDETTSYVLGWFGSGQPNKKDNSDITFLIGGDMMFGRNINYHFQDNDIYKLADQLGNRVFWGTDLSMVNLEGPISATPIPADNSKDEMIFNFPPKTAQILNYLHINAVSLANNHSNNQGASGFINTQNVLKKENILPVGQENIFNESNAVAHFNRGNMKLSVITINALEVKTDITTLIKKEKSAGAKVIVFPHWGTEYELTHSSSQQALAHVWIDAGADMVIGSHPHVIQDIEIYKSKPIFYSLGNLLFDQNFSPETQTGLMVAGKFSDNKLSLVLLPTQIVNFKPSLLMGAPRAEMIQRLTQALPQNNVNIEVNYDKIELDN